MAGFIQNILWNSVEGFVEAGTRTAGQYAGDALIKAGDMIEGSGRSIGGGIERRASNYGTAISGQTYQPSPKPLPSTARKPAIKRSNSSPATTKAVGPTSKAPIGANKYPGASKQVAGATGAAKKQLTSGVAGAKSTAGGLVGGATKGVTGGVVGGATKGLGGAQRAIGSSASSVSSVKPSVPTPKALPKPYPNNVPYGTRATPQNTQSKASNGINAAKGTAESKANNLPKPYGSNAYPTEKKTAVRPGQSKPFKAPEEQKKEDDKKQAPYPGTNTPPGQGNRTPVNVRKQRYKPAERLGSQVESGQKMQHISV